MRIGKSLDRLVNVLAIINADRPVLKSFYRVLRGGAHGGVCICLLDNCCLICRESCLISGIIQRGHRAFESSFAQILASDLIQGGVRLCDRILHRSLDRFWRLLPVGNREHRVCLRSSREKIIDSFQVGTQQTRTTGSNEYSAKKKGYWN